VKRVIASFAVVGLGFLATGCAVPEDGGSAGGKSNSKADVKVEAKKILKEFEENEAAADGKYKNKTLQVSGFVDKIDTEFIDDDEYVIQLGGGSDFELFTVNCDDQSSKDVAPIKKGKKLVVVGDFEDGGDIGVELENCRIK
jgi:tRNA_anti-like